MSKEDCKFLEKLKHCLNCAMVDVDSQTKGVVVL